MSIVSRFAANWQNFLPARSPSASPLGSRCSGNDPTSEQALFAGVLVIYFIHQIEETCRPGGFRQFTDAHMFHSGDDNWPVNIDGVALVNTAYVWLPMALAAIFPQTLRWVGLAWIGLTLINGIIHIVTTIRLRLYNPAWSLRSCCSCPSPSSRWRWASSAARFHRRRRRVDLCSMACLLHTLPIAALLRDPASCSAPSAAAILASS